MEEKDVKEAPVEQTEKTSKKKKENPLQKKIEELDDKLSREHDSYVRLYAEFETYRRRTAEEKLALVSSAAADTIKGLLPVLDDCERALKILENSSDDAAREGTSLIYTKLMEYLKSRGLSPIEAMGQKFDTDFHEAVTGPVGRLERYDNRRGPDRLPSEWKDSQVRQSCSWSITKWQIKEITTRYWGSKRAPLPTT